MAHRQEQSLCFALLELKDFEHISHECGQQASDQILQRFGKCLRAAFRAEDVVARWSREEFVIGLYGASREDGTLRLTQFLQDWQNEPFSCDKQTLQVTFTVGIAVYPEEATDLKGLYRAASGARAQNRVDG